MSEHIVKEGSRDHVTWWDSEGAHCSEPDCEINKKDPTMSERTRRHHTGRAELRTVKAENAALKGDYGELIMAVGNKHEGETRHETALRYILQAEQGSSEASMTGADDE